MGTTELKQAIKRLGVADRFRVCTHGATLHIYLSKAVRQDAELMAHITALIEAKTGRKGITVPGSFPRYTIVPTFEAQS